MQSLVLNYEICSNTFWSSSVTAGQRKLACTSCLVILSQIEVFCHLGYHSVYCDKSQRAFQTNISPLSRNGKCGIVLQKIELCIITNMRISKPTCNRVIQKLVKTASLCLFMSFSIRHCNLASTC